MQNGVPLQLVRPNELASMLGLKVQTLAKLRLQNRGPKWISLGGRAVAYNLADVRDWLEANAHTPTGGPLG
jgi:predicted DNA-binding transcriptional regulator AlpA